MNRKIRVPKFLPVKNCIKMHPKLSFSGDKNDFFSGKGASVNFMGRYGQTIIMG